MVVQGSHSFGRSRRSRRRPRYITSQPDAVLSLSLSLSLSLILTTCTNRRKRHLLQRHR